MTNDEKLQYAKRIGASIRKVHDTDGHLLEEVLNSRILEHERARREARLWLVAVISSIASVVSALAAWSAILLSKP